MVWAIVMGVVGGMGQCGRAVGAVGVSGHGEYVYPMQVSVL